MSRSSSAGTGSAVAVARVLAPHAIIEQDLTRSTSPEQACAELSRIFSVGLAEVALMRVEGRIARSRLRAPFEFQGGCRTDRHYA